MQARSLTEEEIARLRIAFIEGYGHYAVRDRCFFELGINAGARLTELLTLNVGQVYHHGWLADQLELVCRGQSRTVPLNFRAREALSIYIEWKKAKREPLHTEAPLFLSKQGVRLRREAAHRCLIQLFERCGLKGEVTTRSLRKTFATRLRETGVDLGDIQVLLGHKKLSMTERYLGVAEPDLRKAVEKLD